MEDYEEAELFHESAMYDWMSSFNETLNIEDAFKAMPDIIRIPAVCFCCIVLIIGVLGNILVATQTFKSSTLSTAVKSLTLSLSAADLLLLVLCKFRLQMISSSFQFHFHSVNRSATGTALLQRLPLVFGSSRMQIHVIGHGNVISFHHLVKYRLHIFRWLSKVALYLDRIRDGALLPETSGGRSIHRMSLAVPRAERATVDADHLDRVTGLCHSVRRGCGCGRLQRSARP